MAISGNFICVAAISAGAMPLHVALISGKAVLELEHFEGNGQELRELAGRALRLTPSRLRLVTAENAELRNEEVIGDVGSITAMVGEGLELPEWCQKELAEFKFMEAFHQSLSACPCVGGRRPAVAGGQHGDQPEVPGQGPHGGDRQGQDAGRAGLGQAGEGHAEASRDIDPRKHR